MGDSAMDKTLSFIYWEIWQVNNTHICSNSSRNTWLAGNNPHLEFQHLGGRNERLRSWGLFSATKRGWDQLGLCETLSEEIKECKMNSVWLAHSLSKKKIHITYDYGVLGLSESFCFSRQKLPLKEIVLGSRTRLNLGVSLIEQYAGFPSFLLCSFVCFLSTWHKLWSSGKREPQLREIPHQIGL